jgi:transposase
MQTALKTLCKHLPRIKPTFMYRYSNSALEGSINKIKVIKRIAYGYQNFQNFSCPILISFKAKKIANIDLKFKSILAKPFL